MRYDLPDTARRLDTILRDLGYEINEEVDHNRAYRVIVRRTRRPLERARFDALCEGEEQPMTTVEAVQLADGLGFDVRKLLYDEIPRYPERPRNLLDELDLLGNVL